MKSDSKQRTKRNHESKQKKKKGEVRRRIDFNFYQRYKLNYAQDNLWGWVRPDHSQLVIQSVAMATRRRLVAPVTVHRNINVMIRIFSEENIADSNWEINVPQSTRKRFNFSRLVINRRLTNWIIL